MPRARPFESSRLQSSRCESVQAESSRAKPSHTSPSFVSASPTPLGAGLGACVAAAREVELTTGPWRPRAILGDITDMVQHGDDRRNLMLGSPATLAAEQRRCLARARPVTSFAQTAALLSSGVSRRSIYAAPGSWDRRPDFTLILELLAASLRAGARGARCACLDKGSQRVVCLRQAPEIRAVRCTQRFT